MGLLDSIKAGAKKLFEKKNPEVDIEKQLGEDYSKERKKIYDSELRRAAIEATKIKARREAYQMTGLEKLKEANSKYNGRAPSFMQNLAKRIADNKARTLNNLKRTAEMRRIAEQERERRMKMIEARQMQTQKYRSMGSPLKYKPQFSPRPRGRLY